jgi:hypothetical protein
MTDTLALKRALERNIKAVSLRPTAAHGTEVTRATITDGFTCEITDGQWRLISDLPKERGRS